MYTPFETLVEFVECVNRLSGWWIILKHTVGIGNFLELLESPIRLLKGVSTHYGDIFL
jgi:hypothetical protein